MEHLSAIKLERTGTTLILAGIAKVAGEKKKQGFEKGGIGCLCRFCRNEEDKCAT